jgi:hypothetical protein
LDRSPLHQQIDSLPELLQDTIDPLIAVGRSLFTTATGSVTGRLPIVELRNDGPEWIEAQIHTIDGEGFDGRLGPGGSAAHKLPGPLRIRIENRGSERAMIVLEATGADGVSLKMPEKK